MKKFCLVISLTFLGSSVWAAFLDCKSAFPAEGPIYRFSIKKLDPTGGYVYMVQGKRSDVRSATPETQINITGVGKISNEGFSLDLYQKYYPGAAAVGNLSSTGKLSVNTYKAALTLGDDKNIQLVCSDVQANGN